MTDSNVGKDFRDEEDEEGNVRIPWNSALSHGRERERERKARKRSVVDCEKKKTLTPSSPANNNNNNKIQFFGGLGWLVQASDRSHSFIS